MSSLNYASTMDGSERYIEEPTVSIQHDDEERTTTLSRRTFLEAIGFTALTAAMSGCKPPEQKIVPYLRQPVEFTPGVADWYASTCAGCSAACGALVKVRDGRPIKLEGNPDHPLSQGGLCAVAHAMVFDLFDASRLRAPLMDHKASTWEKVDRDLTAKLAAIVRSGGKVRVLSSTITSPTSLAVISTFLGHFADGRHIMRDASSISALGASHARTHGVEVTPHYRFDAAKLIVSFETDFLGTWISPVEFAAGYASARTPDAQGRMLRHVQFESRVSLTGANADKRVVASPDEQRACLLAIAARIASKSASTTQIPPTASTLQPELQRTAESIADELWAHRGESIVVCGRNDVDVQTVVNAINAMLDNYGHTLDIASPSRQKPGSDRAMEELVREMAAGEIAALFIVGANPLYDYYDPQGFRAAIGKVPLTASFASRSDETASVVGYVCPDHHFLESWNDSEPVAGVFSLTQPSIAPLFDTRAYQHSLLKWIGDSRSYYDVLREHWRTNVFGATSTQAEFERLWEKALRDGIFVSNTQPSVQPSFIATSIDEPVRRLASQPAATSPMLLLYESIALRDGAHAGSPWLHEFPDPVTKITWGNYLCVSPATARKLDLEEGRVVEVVCDNGTIEAPTHIQAGQHDGIVALALGYGRLNAGAAGSNLGASGWPLMKFNADACDNIIAKAQLRRTERVVEPAITQTHDSMEGRDLIRELTLGGFVKGETPRREGEHHDYTMWPGHEYTGHKWGMTVDMNACIGCGACVLSCQAENNIPVVGREEVINRREMHWIRIDRYIDGAENNPTMRFQPVMCAQCDNASCESVCPVLATVHSSEGLSQQIYNRCVGTRYCANNCPYKVRRFNWFEYNHTDPIANLALNPDVTVRTRGVMEKCSFCVQRIEEARIRSRNENRELADGEIVTACQQSCPTKAISFGDVRDKHSRVAQLKGGQRNYVLLEETNVRPALSYLARIRNTEEENHGVS